MARVVWAREALRNIDAIGEYIGQFSAAYANAVVVALIEATSILKTFPRAGRAVPSDESEELRELIFDSYHIFYAVHAEHVEIVGVLHGASDVARRIEEQRGRDDN